MVWKIIRRVLAIIIRVTVWHPVWSLVIVCAGLGIAGLIALARQPSVTQQALGTPLPLALSPPVVAHRVPITSADPLKPASTVENYLEGMASFHAQPMWDALDPATRDAMQKQGGSESQLQQRLNSAKQSGGSYDGITFVGGYHKSDGNTYFFYVVSRQGFAGNGLHDQVFFVFTVGPNGKILRVE